MTEEYSTKPTEPEYNHSVSNSEDHGEVHDAGDIEETSNSLINPLTPRLHTLHDYIINSKQATELVSTHSPGREDATQFVTRHWIPREKESSPSKQLFSSDELSVIEDSSLISMENDTLDHAEVLEAMQKLKVKTKRGRPRKAVSKKMNKFFTLPRKKKSKAKGVGLKQISHFCLNNSLTEEKSVFETGVLMGLIPLDSKEKSMEKISAQLKI